MHDCKKALNFFHQSFCRRIEAMPAPHKVGSFSYSMNFGPKPLRQRTAPKVRQGNIQNSYPGNVLYPYTLPEQVGDRLRLQYVRTHLSIWDTVCVICTASSDPSIHKFINHQTRLACVPILVVPSGMLCNFEVRSHRNCKLLIVPAGFYLGYLRGRSSTPPPPPPKNVVIISVYE